MAELAQTVRPLEDLSVVTLLGIRFWDAALDEQVSDSLVVTARPQAAAGPVVSAFRTASGFYAFQGLPGMRDYEYGAAVAPSSPPARKTFVIQVQDLRRRFLPALFRVALPLPYRGLYPGGIDSPPDESSLPGFLLFSAPTRPPVPGLAAVRAQLLDRAAQAPAAHAVLEVEVRGIVWRGIADDSGQVALLFPQPTMEVNLNSSPPGLLAVPLRQQQWELAVRVAYGPSALDFSDGETLPDLASILGQPPGFLWPTAGGGPVAEWNWSLVFGRELVLRTVDPADPRRASELWVDSGSSPP